MKTLMLMLAAVSFAHADTLVDFDQNRSSLESSIQKPLFSMAAPKRVSDDGLVTRAAAFIKGAEPLEASTKELSPNAFCSTERDCVDFVFEPADEKTEYFPLRSTEYREECRHGPRGERDCWCRSQWTTTARVQIRIEGRKAPLPWERERFRMCLEGNWVNYYEIATAFEYDSKFIDRTAVVIATPKQKIAMRPDADGIALTAFKYEAGKFSAAFSDKWASYYAGEQTVIKVQLKKKVFLGSRTVAEKELRVAPAADYAVEFTGSFDDGKYFADWSFARPGKVSTDKVIDKDDTPVIELKKAASAAATR